jgi:hypothetical protein
MAQWGRNGGNSEVIGRLGGRQCRDGNGSYVLVEKATLGHNARGGAGHVVADIAAQKALRDEFDRECRALDSVGWWHTHLKHVGLFYSSVDRQNQASWSDPNSIGIVLHPGLEGEALKVFRGPESVEMRRVTSLEVIRLAAAARRAETQRPPFAGPRVPKGPAAGDVIHWHYQVPERGARTATLIAICLATAAIVLGTMASVSLWLSM